MYLKEEEALIGICLKNPVITLRPIRGRREEKPCVGSKCIAYWKWINYEEKIGYCSASYDADIPIEDQIQYDELRANQKIVLNKEKPCGEPCS